MTKNETVKQIKEKLAKVTESADPLLELYESDNRKTVQKELAKVRKRLIRLNQLKVEHDYRLAFEKNYHSLGYQLIAGVDEVGRGPLAGPVVAAAVILPERCEQLIGVNDSKQLSNAKRKQFAEMIKKVAIAYAVSVVPAETIDQVNIYQATKMAMKDSLSQLKPQPEYVLVDAMTLDIEIPQKSLVKGDQKSLSIAAASILAKVYRDKLMADYGKDYPEYGWDRNAGYGTAEHLEALNQLGYTPYHRRSFKPVRDITRFNQR